MLFLIFYKNQILGIGNQFDVVEVNRKLARLDLLLTRKATYASPFDLEYYGKLREVFFFILFQIKSN